MFFHEKLAQQVKKDILAKDFLNGPRETHFCKDGREGEADEETEKTRVKIYLIFFKKFAERFSGKTFLFSFLLEFAFIRRRKKFLLVFEVCHIFRQIYLKAGNFEKPEKSIQLDDILMRVLGKKTPRNPTLECTHIRLKCRK